MLGLCSNVIFLTFNNILPAGINVEDVGFVIFQKKKVISVEEIRKETNLPL